MQIEAAAEMDRPGIKFPRRHNDPARAATAPVRAPLRGGTSPQLHTELTLGRRFGMMTMEDSLARLVKAGAISEAEARLWAGHAADLAALLR